MPEARKLPVQEISYDKMMKLLDLDHEQFIDLCILMGCDYVPSIKGSYNTVIYDTVWTTCLFDIILRNRTKKSIWIDQEAQEYWNNS